MDRSIWASEASVASSPASAYLERMSETPRAFSVAPEHHRLRLDRYIAAVRGDLNRRAIAHRLRTGCVRVNGLPKDARYFVKRGDSVEIAEPLVPGPEEPREILRTDRLIAVAKPPGIPTNPVPGHARSVLGWVEQRAPHPPGVVHRLDRDTSGIVVFSLSPEGHRALEAAFAERTVRKSYLALVPGRIRPRRGTIDRPIQRDASGGMRVDPRGLPARTTYRTIHDSSTCSLLEVHPHSGRTHQVRIHLASIGHPIAGDPLYGDPRHTLGAPRLWLHAFALELPPPLAEILGAPRRIECPLWEDLVLHLTALGLPYSARKT